jgi:hypothetical protein
MKARHFVGNKQEIARMIAEFDGEIRGAIIFVEDHAVADEPASDFFAAMEPLMVPHVTIDNSRSAIYQRRGDE